MVIFYKSIAAAFKIDNASYTILVLVFLCNSFIPSKDRRGTVCSGPGKRDTAKATVRLCVWKKSNVRIRKDARVLLRHYGIIQILG